MGRDRTAIDLGISDKDLKSLQKSLDRIKDKFSQRKANTEINKIVFSYMKDKFLI